MKKVAYTGIYYHNTNRSSMDRFYLYEKMNRRFIPVKGNSITRKLARHSSRPVVKVQKSNKAYGICKNSQRINFQFHIYRTPRKNAHMQG